MKNEMNETLDFDSSNQISDKLPAFLNVLTILTFIGSGLTILGAIYNILSVEQQKETIEMLRNQSAGAQVVSQFFSSDMIKILEVSLENNLLLNGSSIFVGLACLASAFLMRKYKKSGFYLYIAASIVSILIPISVFGLGLMGALMLFGHLFTVAFMVMYGVNYRYLRN